MFKKQGIALTQRGNQHSQPYIAQPRESLQIPHKDLLVAAARALGWHFRTCSHFRGAVCLRPLQRLSVPGLSLLCELLVAVLLEICRYNRLCKRCTTVDHRCTISGVAQGLSPEYMINCPQPLSLGSPAIPICLTRKSRCYLDVLRNPVGRFGWHNAPIGNSPISCIYVSPIFILHLSDNSWWPLINICPVLLTRTFPTRPDLCPRFSHTICLAVINFDPVPCGLHDRPPKV
ncbi:hypothetical protein J6590_071184 [Homalodisca vitripennis]|nr:hypothetical protein J6590_071184 [Homalodisca vitripennis]